MFLTTEGLRIEGVLGMAPTKKTPKTPKKTPKAKRRSKPATSFKKKKLTPARSGKVFKKNRSETKRKRGSRPISDSSFAASQLTSSMVSTPLSSLQPHKRRRQASPGPVQMVASSPCPPLQSSPSSPCPPLPLPVATLQPGQGAEAASTSTARRGARKPLLLPPQGAVAREASLGHLFRNHHNFAPLQDDITRTAVSSSVCSLVRSEDSEVIVIDDDDDSETGEDSAVERLGQEMLGLVGGDTVPATPRTLETMERELEEVTVNSEMGDDTIVIDVTGGDGVLDMTAGDVEVVAEVAGPLGAGDLQEVTRRYQQQWPQLDYIPIMTPRQGKRRERIRGRGARQRGGASRGAALRLPVHLAPAHLAAGPRFRPQNQTRIDTDFSGRGSRGGVFRSVSVPDPPISGVTGSGAPAGVWRSGKWWPGGPPCGWGRRAGGPTGGPALLLLTVATWPWLMVTTRPSAAKVGGKGGVGLRMRIENVRYRNTEVVR